MNKNVLDVNSITFGKYRGKKLEVMLKDRDYCKWIINEDWFQTNYEYLYNKVLEYDPRKFFLPDSPIEAENFIDKYIYFTIKNLFKNSR